MSFKNNSRFTPEVDQKIRERLARSRNSFQALTRGIYPESGQSTVEPVDQNPSETKEAALRLNDRKPMADEISPKEKESILVDFKKPEEK